MAGAGGRFERSARFWLRAYPRRWREARAEELLAVLADVAGPDARRLDARAAVDLVRAGWATRWRGRPPWWRWALYRGFDVRLPAAWREWVYDDLRGALWPVRIAGQTFVVFVLMYSAMWAVLFRGMDAWSSGLSGYAYMMGMFVVTAWFGSPSRLRRDRVRHLAPRPGEPLTEGSLFVVAEYRRRVLAGPGLWWASACAFVLTVLAGVAMLVGPSGWWTRSTWGGPEGVGTEFEVGPVVDRRLAWVLVAVAVGVGVLVARRGRRRIDRRAAELQPEPYRALIGVGPAFAGRIVLATALIAAELVVEATGVWAVTFSPYVVLLGSATVAWSLAAIPAARRYPDLALVDVWRMAVFRRQLGPDVPVPGITRVGAAVPVGAVVAPRGLGTPPFTLMA